MTTEKQAAEELDRYITARQQGQEAGENALVDDLLALAENVSQDQLTHHRVLRKVQSRPRRAIRPTFTRLSTVAAAVMLVSILFMTVPSIRAQVESLFNFFLPGETNMNPGLAPTASPPEDESLIAPASTPETLIRLSLEQVQAAVAAAPDITFAVHTPDYLPDGFTYLEGLVEPSWGFVSLFYTCDNWLADLSLSITDVRIHGLSNLAAPVGADAEIEFVQVGGSSAEYVQGDFAADGLWDSNAPVQMLSWVEGNVHYRLRTSSQSPGCSVTQTDLIAIAESID